LKVSGHTWVFKEISKLSDFVADYIKMRRDPLDICEHLKQMLPNADPIYLRNQSRVLATRPPEDLDGFIENAIEKSDYPTMQEYLVYVRTSVSVAK
jgi:hypothetical protein